MKRRIISVLAAAAMVFSLTANFTALAAGAAVVTLDPSTASPFNNGEFQGWGTSMGWWGNRIGYSDTLAQKAAEIFYDEETGLGLDIVRYNVGGGDHPDHNHITRSDSKLPCFAVPTLDSSKNPTKDSTGKFIYTYDWEADKNQVNVLKKIKAENDNVHIEGYTNSPPWFMTNSLCSGGGTNGAENLATENYDDFAEFIGDVAEHFETAGLKFDSYSPMNEPKPETKYWAAMNEKQEGNLVAQGEHQSKLITAMRSEFDKRNIDTIIAGMDETDINYSISAYNSLTDDAKAALGRIDTHTYGHKGGGFDRAGLKSTAQTANKNLWMSEVDGGWDGFGLSQRIIEDMNGMQPSAWVMWDIIDSHKDSNFTNSKGVKSEANNALNPTGTLWGVGMADHDNETIQLANKYYFYGQFTRYINPGDTIIASSNSTLAAYNKTSGDIKIVALNSSSKDAEYEFDLSAFDKVGYGVKEIRTNNLTGSAAEHWTEISDEAVLSAKKLTATAKAGTVTTFVIGDFITIGGSDERINLDDTKNLTVLGDTAVTNPQWSVSDSSVASITESGALTAKKTGNVTVTVTADGGLTATRDFVVYFEITGAGDRMKLGGSAQLSVGKEFEGKNVTWTSSDDDIATVTQTGLVTGNKPGTVTITASYNGVEATKTMTVLSYVLSGTQSWCNSSNDPKDSDDYTHVADGDFSTCFDGMTGGWVMYDYGMPYTATAVKLAARSGSDEYLKRTVGGKVQGSNDAINWTDLFEVTTQLEADKYTTIPAEQLKSGKAFRYFRYTNETAMANIAEFIIEGAPAVEGVPAGEPVLEDIEAFTDDFEGSTNIFGAEQGTLSASKNTVFASGLARFGNVFAPVKSKAVSALDEPLTLGSNQKFRLTFNMFAGWESSGRPNSFAIKDKDGKEAVAIYITGGGYRLQEIRIGGTNVLTDDATHIAQSRTKFGTSKSGANEWNHKDQPFRNYVGYNKTVEIIADGAGNVSVSLTGGLEDTSVTGMLDTPVSIGSIEAEGDYNSSVNAIVGYDNFDGDLITYKEDFEPVTPPAPTDPPVLPESGELISLDFNNKDLRSSSEYGKATALGTAKFAEVDGKTCLQLDGEGTAIKLTDINGNPLLTGQENMTISFKVKPANVKPTWWLYAAPDDTAPTFENEKYFGILGENANLKVQRFNNSGARSAEAASTYTTDAWNDVLVSVNDKVTTLFVNGELAGAASSTVNVADLLGDKSVLYIGKANWGNNGEYATGYIDDFVIYNYSIPYVTSLANGDTVSYTSDYKSDAPFDMLIAAKDESGKLIGLKKNTDKGSFTVPANTEYTLTEYVWKGMKPVTNSIDINIEDISKGAYLFTHFRGEDTANGEQIYFSVSTDGENWKSLNGSAPVLTSTVGDKGVRDPFIIRTNDNKFVIIATDLKINGGSGWGAAQSAGSKNIIVWKSDDLVNWSSASSVQVSPSNAGCTWAPEAIYDPEEQKYMVFWASRVSDDSYSHHRIYKAYTSDFETFEPAELYIEKDFQVIDTTIIEDKGVYYRFTKNEDTGEKYIFMEKCTGLNGTWEEVSTFNRNQKNFEGPTIFKLNGQERWCLMLDNYGGSGYVPFVTDNLASGVFEAAGSVKYDATYRHGTVMPITAEEYINLVTKYGF